MNTNWRKKVFERLNCKGVAINEGNGDLLVQGEVVSKTPNPMVIYWAPNPPTYTTSYSGSGLPYHDSIQAYNKTPNVGAVKCINRKFEFRIKYPNSYYIGLGSFYVPPHLHFKICEEAHWEEGTGGVRWILPTPQNKVNSNNNLNSDEMNTKFLNNNNNNLNSVEMNTKFLNNNNNNNNNLISENNNNNLISENISNFTNNNSNNNNLLNKEINKLVETDDYYTIQIDSGTPFRTLTYPSPPSKQPRDSPMFYYCNRNSLPVRSQEQVLRDSGFPNMNRMPDNFWGLKPPL